eukprot:365351_1
MHCINLQFIIFLYSVCDCTNYYFSSSSGSNSNKGTQIDSPWKSFSKLENVSIKAADNILLKSNDLFNEQLFLQNIHGTELNPVTITTYNTTNTLYYHRAIINKNQDLDETNSTILCLNCEGIIISNLELCHSHYGIAIIYDSPPSSKIVSDILIKNNYFHNLNGYGLPNTSSWWGAAIVTGQNTNNGRVTIHNLNILNNFCNESDTFFKFQWYAKYAAAIMSGTISGNALTHNYYNVVKLGDIMNNFTITNNIFLHNAPIKYFDFGTTDIIVGHTDNVSSIINNEFGYRGEWNTSKDGCAIDFETNPISLIVTNNYIHHSYAAGIMVYGHPQSGQLPQNITIRNNVLIQDGCYQMSKDHGAIAFMWPNTSGIVENCIFIKCQNNLSVPIFNDNNKSENVETWKFVNNTIYNETDNVVDDPIITYNQNGNDGSIVITAKCGNNVANECVIRYTLNGEKPTINSKEYKGKISINITTAVFFKAFKNDMIDSSAVGKIVALQNNDGNTKRP